VKPPSLLLADDNNTLVEREAELLMPFFDILAVVHDGQELISTALRLNPDVIVTDISMPLLTGIDAVHNLRNAGSTSKFVFLTVHTEGEFLDACLEEGALGFVAKSHMKDDLVACIHSAMEGKLFVSPTLLPADKTVLSG
jgi:DNA-binding NarL/FixJ family response regulator